MSMTPKNNKFTRTFYKTIETQEKYTDLQEQKIQTDQIYSFQNAILDRLIQHLNNTKKLSALSKITGKNILLNDFDGMRDCLIKFMEKYGKIENEISEIKQNTKETENEIKIFKKKSFDLRFMKSYEESRVKPKKKH